MVEDRAQFWELTDRGVTFAYLEPKRRVHLDTLFDWLTGTTHKTGADSASE